MAALSLTCHYVSGTTGANQVQTGIYCGKLTKDQKFSDNHRTLCPGDSSLFRSLLPDSHTTPDRSEQQLGATWSTMCMWITSVSLNVKRCLWGKWPIFLFTSFWIPFSCKYVTILWAFPRNGNSSEFLPKSMNQSAKKMEIYIKITSCQFYHRVFK